MTSSKSECHSKVQLVTLTSDQPAGFQRPLLGFSESARMVHRPQRNMLLTGSLVYYKRLELRNSQVEEMHKARCGGRGTELPSPPPFPRHPLSSHPHVFTNLEAFLT